MMMMIMIYDMIYMLTAIGLTPSGSSTVHIYTQTIRRTTQSTQRIIKQNDDDDDDDNEHFESAKQIA